MSSEVAIDARNLSKIYRIYERPEHRLIQMATLGRVRHFKEFAALTDVSLTVNRGETMGIVGRNGSGKSTLLQMICGTLQPNSGSVSVKGRIAALLELGAGFNGEFTGRENAYMNGAILGIGREEMDARFDDIAHFAGIGDFIERPVKTYSSGMFVRLAFAVATAVEPDILVVDEALAVGDEAFQRKCFARIEAIKERGGTILFVSHGAQTILQLCDRAVLLDAGEKLLEGEPKLVVSQYQRLVNVEGTAANETRKYIRSLAASAQADDTDATLPSSLTEPHSAAHSFRKPGNSVPDEPAWLDPTLLPTSTVQYEERGAKITKLRIETAEGREVNVLSLGRRYRLLYDAQFSQPAERVIFGFQIKTVSGLALGGANSLDVKPAQLAHAAAGAVARIEFEFECRCMPGVYLMDVGIMGSQGDQTHFLHRILDAAIFRVAPESGRFDQGLISIEAKMSVELMYQELPTSTQAGHARRKLSHDH